MTEQDIVNIATKYISEAKKTLDTSYRNKLKQESYLGELTDLQILTDSKNSLEKALDMLKPIRPDEYKKHIQLLKNIDEEIEKYKPKPEPVKKTYKSKSVISKDNKFKVSLKKGGKNNVL